MVFHGQGGECGFAHGVVFLAPLRLFLRLITSSPLPGLPFGARKRRRRLKRLKNSAALEILRRSPSSCGRCNPRGMTNERTRKRGGGSSEEEGETVTGRRLRSRRCGRGLHRMSPALAVS
ncbi:hypothetical protein B296_00052130 [Ensete ventricosum]|uniref:Uncharacterized protein n=1 Tax=Ensete ventricosum TaxID=4639 RepID=A0A426XJ52_ENSVE|nr:hypothetical protein B296_00052130 [Ensete ventricosum]